jgi:osmotically-inducible protein OsmY
MEGTAMKQLNYIPTIILAAMLATALGCASTSKSTSTSKPEKESAGEYIDDAVITTKVKKAIFDESSLKSSEINVETYKGVVQLSGFVSSEADIKKAVEVTRGVKGVTSVKNDMRLKPKE